MKNNAFSEFFELQKNYKQPYSISGAEFIIGTCSDMQIMLLNFSPDPVANLKTIIYYLPHHLKRLIYDMWRFFSNVITKIHVYQISATL